MTLSSEDILFVSRGTGVVPWYRCGLPALNLGCDWVGVTGEPEHLHLVTALTRGGYDLPEFDDYKIVVLQQVMGVAWRNEIIRLKKAGVRVLYEVDDYLHGVRKISSHQAKAAYSKERLKEYEICMMQADGLICSTPWLAERYSSFNANAYLAENSIDGLRYAKFSLPKRRSLNIGWAGGEGHLESVKPWMASIEKILDKYPHTRFISIGLPVAKLLNRPRQAVALPFCAIENFPGALTSFDIAIAPAGRSAFFQAKSDLRFLETGALGIPIVADPFVYGSIRHEETGMWAETPKDAYEALEALVWDKDERDTIGANAREHVLSNRSIEKQVDQWEKIFVAVMDS